MLNVGVVAVDSGIVVVMFAIDNFGFSGILVGINGVTKLIFQYFYSLHKL